VCVADIVEERQTSTLYQCQHVGCADGHLMRQTYTLKESGKYTFGCLWEAQDFATVSSSTQQPVPPSSSDHHTNQSRSRDPITATSNAPPPCQTRTLTRLRRTPTRRWARRRSIVRRLTHIRNTAAILLRNHVNLARRVAAHEQAALTIPRKAYRAEAGVGASGKVGVGYDVGGARGAICGRSRRAVAVELDMAELVADGLLAIPDENVREK
jgi:hypothetical protein